MADVVNTFFPGKYAAIKIDSDSADDLDGTPIDSVNVAGTVNFIQHSIFRSALIDITPLNAFAFEGASMPVQNRILVRGNCDQSVNPGYLNKLPVTVTYWPNYTNTSNYRRFSAWLMRLDSIAPSDGPSMFEAVLEADGRTVTLSWT